MCESNSQLFNEKYIIIIIVFLVTCIIYYKNIEKFINRSVNKDKKEKDWDIWTEETKHEEKDVNKWYYVLGGSVNRYKGEWSNGLANGKGVREYFGSSDNSHSIIECNFVDGSANGYGKQTFDITQDDERFAPYYEGEFKNGKHHGNGTYYYGNGCYRKGNLIEHKFEGKGIYYDSFKKKTWVGTYVDDTRDIDNGVWIKGKVSLEDAFKDKINETIEIKIR
jgi:hypothetical protein